MIKIIRITSILTFVMLLFGLLLKTMHWTGANVLLTCGYRHLLIIDRIPYRWVA